MSSADWQESDRVFAGVLSAFGSKTKAIPIGGYGTFDGVMTGAFRSPRIEGEFSGEQMRAWDVVWGAVRGKALIQNSYVDVTDVSITSGSSVIKTAGRFSLGFPRKDGGEEINARVEIASRPVADLRHAFAIDEYDINGLLSGEFTIAGKYLTPIGSGRMEIVDPLFYGEPVDSASSTVLLEGKGVRLPNVQILKGGGRGTGNAYIGWDGTYAFSFNAQAIQAESITASKNIGLPVSALLNFTAAGSGTFDAPKFEVQGTLSDVFVADEGIGQINGIINVSGELMTLQLEAASRRLSVSVVGSIAMTPEWDANVRVNVFDTSLDPYVRLFLPQLSPYTTAVASGSVQIRGELKDIDQLLVDATVDRLDMRLFDYALHNERPIRLALDRHAVRVTDMRLIGQDTQVDIAGIANLHDETINMRANGDANLAVLQGFVSDLRSSGAANLSATLEGPIKNPVVGGTLAIKNGRVRWFALPHALEKIDGEARFDSRGVNLDGLTGELGGGAVTFGGRIDKEGYLPGRLDVTMSGRDMRLRFPEGMRSLVDADLTLQGTAENAVLSGLVTVKDAVYREAFTTTGSLFDFSQDQSLAPAAPPPTETLPVRLDVRVNAPSTLQIDNRTLRLVATADLQLRGTIDKPVLLGRAEIDRGEALFEGKRYLITRGTVDFNNPTPDRAVSRHRSGDAHPRASGNLSGHAAHHRAAGRAELHLQFGSAAGRGRDPGPGVRRRDAGGQRRAPAVRREHAAAAPVPGACRACAHRRPVLGSESRGRRDVRRRYVPDHPVAAGSQRAVDKRTGARDASDGAQAPLRAAVPHRTRAASPRPAAPHRSSCSSSTRPIVSPGSCRATKTAPTPSTGASGRFSDGP